MNISLVTLQADQKSIHLYFTRLALRVDQNDVLGLQIGLAAAELSQFESRAQKLDM